MKFYGGPLDGSVLPLPDNANRYEYPIPIPVRWVDQDFKTPATESFTRRHVYESRRLRTGEAVMFYTGVV